MAKRKKTETAVPDPEPQTVADEAPAPAGDIPGDIPADTEAAGLPEYSHCACGAALVMVSEQVADVCEHCGHLSADGTLYKTPEAAALADARHGDAVPGLTAELATRINTFATTRRAEYERLIAVDPSGEDGDVWGDYDKAEAAFLESLPQDFPLDASALMGDVEAGTWTPLPVPGAPVEATPAASAEAPAPETPAPAQPRQMPLLPAEPFDAEKAFADIAKKAHDVEAYRALHDEKKEAASAAKKRLEAAELLLEQTVTTYDQKARAWAEHQEIEAAQHAAYLEKLEADAAAKDEAVPQALSDGMAAILAEALPDATVAVMGPGQIDVTCPAPLPDTSVPTCPCGNALALDTEKARGTCDECDAMDPEGNEPEQRATC